MLYVVATPIGNLEDITLRAIRILGEVDLIAAEDTRRTRHLLVKYKITTPLISWHQHSRGGKLNKIINVLTAGQQVAIVTDAGTPGIADPGGLLVQAAREADIKVVPIPGPSAVSAILSVAGIPTDTWLFLGWLPKKKGRVSLFKEIKNLSVPIVIFESPHRLIKTLGDITSHLSDKQLIIGRELTKLHEEILTDSTQNLIKHFTKHPPKGEFVIVIT